MSKAKELEAISTLCVKLLCDDATYPQIYLEKIARRDFSVFAEFADDALYSMGDEWIHESAENGISIDDIINVCDVELQNAWDEFWAMSAEEQREIIDIEELDWILEQERLSR